MDNTLFLIATLVSAIILVILLIMKARLHAFISLVIACFYVGILTGMPLLKICSSIEAGMGSTLGFLATVLGLGSILGKMLEESGGAERLARTLINTLGKKRANWAMMIVGLLTGIPVFFQVGFVLLIPLVISVARATGLSIVAIGVPMGVSLQIVHCMLPPHPAAMAIAATLNADLGKVILLGLVACIPAAIIAGPFYAKILSKNIKTDLKALTEPVTPVPDSALPKFGITLFTILLPMIIMVAKTIFDLTSLKTSSYADIVNFIGNPITALLISAFFAYWSLGLCRGFNRNQLLKFTEQCFGPVAGILLVIGAGGAFNKVLLDSGLGTQLGDVLASLSLSPLILAWFVAAMMRLSVGSATVAMMTATGIVLPILPQYPNLDPALVALAVGSGAAALAYAFQALAHAGDHIVAAKNIYGGTYNLLAHTLPDYGIEATFVDPFDYDAIEAAIKPNTKAVQIETLGNPNSEVVDIERIAKIAHAHNIPLVVDNTFATPYLVRPIEYGADIVIHSATKFIGGHGTTLGGVIVDSGKFDWVGAADKFPWLVEPNVSYHGVSFAKDTAPAAFVTYIRAILLRDTGATISPVHSFIFLQGLETLSLRVERHVENALKVVQYLKNQPLVEKVNHPSISTNEEQQALYKKYFPNGGGSIFTFEIKGGAAEAQKFIDNLELFSLLANVADVKSLAIHPASTTHSECNEAELLDQGIKPNTIRLSIGTENIDDIIEDLDEAFKALQ